MAFKGLEDRFKAKAEQLYGFGELHNSDQIHPLVTFRPDDPDADETTNDTRALPIKSMKRDLVRIGKLSKSREGLLFLAKQELLQTGNAFSETRVINPLFVIGNIQPYKHISRTLTGTVDFALKGDTSQASPASTDAIGGAGRLQVQTAKDAIASATGDRGVNGILSILPSSTLVSLLQTALTIKNSGTTPVDGRPELTIDSNKYYSVLMWQKYQKIQPFASVTGRVKAQLRVGNVKGAVNTITRGISNAISNAKRVVAGVGIADALTAPLGRGYDTEGIDGRRYFITSADKADRYLVNSVEWSVDGDNRAIPVISTSYLRNEPFPINGKVAVPAAIEAKILKLPKEEKFTNNKTISGLLSKANKIVKDVKKAIQAVNPILQANIDLIGLLKEHDPSVPILPDENPAEAHMNFPRLALRQRYEDQLDELQKQLQKQRDGDDKGYYGKTYWKKVYGKPPTGLNYGGRKGTGDYSDVPNKTRDPIGSYLKDSMNLFTVLEESENATEVSPQMLKQIRDYGGTDSIDLIFFDVVNKTVIPFRAFLSGIQERVMPQFNETAYIGRIERNVVYMNVKREISFTLDVHAFSEDELFNIWTKIDRLKGLCYPSDFDRDNGFLVPPLIKLTMGNLFRDQPGYILNLDIQVEDNISWNIEDGQQIPHGVKLSLTYSILEKQQMRAGSKFNGIKLTEPVK
jgi:hypothetical protein